MSDAVDDPGRVGGDACDESVADGALVARTRSGSPDALARLYRRYGRMVYHVAFRFLADESDAEDLLHDVFVGLPEALRHYEERGRFEPWLKRVAVRAALMKLRTRRPHEPLTALPSGLDPLGATPEERVELRRAVSALSDEQRAVLMLKEVEGYTHAEIGDSLGISEGASAARLHRALTALRKALDIDGREG